MARETRSAEIRRRSYEVLELGAHGDRLSILVSYALVILIVVNLLSVVLDSVPALNARYGVLFYAIELVSLVAFTIEYVLRVWSRSSTRHSAISPASERGCATC